MNFKMQEAIFDDLAELAEVMTEAMKADAFWTTMKGPLSFDKELEFQIRNLELREKVGVPLGAAQTWKVVDDKGKILAWAGLGIPMQLTEEEDASFRSKFELPACRNEQLYQFYQQKIFNGIYNLGYDPKKHFLRQNMMVLPSYQRQGLGRMLTEKLNEIADAAGGTTYMRARPWSASLSYKMGYEVLDRVDIDLADFGSAGGKTCIFMMRREPGAKSDAGRVLALV